MDTTGTCVATISGITIIGNPIWLCVMLFVLLLRATVSEALDSPKSVGLHLTASQVPAKDWPAYRRDSGLTGFSPLAGGLHKAPTILWAFDLGGAKVNTEQAQLIDLNGDNRYELLRVLADRIICQSLEGTELWNSPLPNPVVTQVRDFSGDGSRGLLVDATTGVEQQKYMVSGINGKAILLYRSRNEFGRSERFGKLLPSVAGEQFCAWWSGDTEGRVGDSQKHAVGYLWSFEDGLHSPNLRFHVQETGSIYAPLHLFADMDGDGRQEMIMISHEQGWIYDLVTGEKKVQSSWGPQIRTYWANTAAMPLAEGESPSLLMINPMIPGVQVVTQQGNNLISKWKQVIGEIEDQYQKKVSIDRAAPDPFVDLDGDGDIEILAAVTNEHGDQRTNLVIFNANDGTRAYDESSQFVLTVDDLDGDNLPELLIQQEENGFRICNWNGQTFVDRWHGDNVSPVLSPMPPEGHLARSVGSRNTLKNMPLQRDYEDSSLFLVRFGDGVFSCRLTSESLERVRPAKEDTSSQQTESDDLLKNGYAWDGRSLSIEKKGQRHVTYQIPQRTAYSAAPPLVGELGGSQRIIVREFTGAMISLSPIGSDRKVLVENNPTTAANLVVTAEGNSLVDLDGDGDCELLTLAKAAGGAIQIVAIDAAGNRQLEIIPPKHATEVSLGPTGSLGVGRGRWIVARYRISNQNTRVIAYNGKNGKALWNRDFLGPSRTAATSFVLHLPTAVYDVDRDGAEDLIASSENHYEVISVKDNRTITPNLAITNCVPGHWGAYATPIVADLLGKGKPFVFHNNAYGLNLLTEFDGTPVWHYGLTRDTTHTSKSGFADLDGDGSIEIVTTQKDGLLRAFDARPTDKKCPSCPSDQTLNATNHAGHMRWNYKLSPPVSDFASLDLDGDGKTELLCGSGTGLCALKEIDGACQVLWSVAISGVGAPVICDLNDDQLPEILVTTSEGVLYCLGNRVD